MKKWKHPDDLDLVEEHKTAATSAKRWEACSGDAITTDGLTTLLSVYAGQVGTYATLVWQAPALSLTGQSFLLLIVLGDYQRGQK